MSRREGDPDPAVVHDVLLELAAEVAERFGDRTPTDDEVRSYLIERLIAEGRTPEEARRFLDE